jgi:hypothetical protein
MRAQIAVGVEELAVKLGQTQPSTSDNGRETRFLTRFKVCAVPSAQQA